MKFYPVVDHIPSNQLRAMGITLDRTESVIPRLFFQGKQLFRNQIQAIYAGEKRQPRKGEWYLSGNPVEAYHAPNDLHGVFHIAQLVITEEVTTTRILHIPSEASSVD